MKSHKTETNEVINTKEKEVSGKLKTNISSKDKTLYLMNYFCNNEYEQKEIKKWINDKGLDFVYNFVIENFELNTADVIMNDPENEYTRIADKVHGIERKRLSENE